MNFFQVFFKLILSCWVSHHLLHVELVFLGVRQSDECILLVTQLLLELSLELFVDLVSQKSFFSSIVLNEVRLKTTDQTNFLDLLLSLHTLFHFIFFWKVWRNLRSLILIILDEFDILLVFDFHQCRRTRFKSHFVLLLVLLISILLIFFLFFFFDLVVLFCFLWGLLLFFRFLLFVLFCDNCLVRVLEHFIFLVFEFLFDGLKFEQQSFQVS